MAELEQPDLMRHDSMHEVWIQAIYHYLQSRD